MRQRHSHPPFVVKIDALYYGYRKNVMNAPIIYRLSIERFRCIKTFTWHPAKGVNVILGGGDVGKTTVLDAIALLLSPTNPAMLSDTDYHARAVDPPFGDRAGDRHAARRHLDDPCTRPNMSTHPRIIGRNVLPLSRDIVGKRCQRLQVLVGRA